MINSFIYPTDLAVCDSLDRRVSLALFRDVQVSIALRLMGFRCDHHAVIIFFLTNINDDDCFCNLHAAFWARQNQNS